MDKYPLLYIASGLLLAGLSILGCRPNSAQSLDDYPKQGHMHAVSVRPAPAAEAPNLIPAETFEAWYAGAPSPSSNAIVLPAKNSAIERESQDTASGQISLKQVWSASDNPWRPEDCFGVQATGLEKNSRYKLSVKAKTINESSAAVEAYGMRPDSPLWQIALKNWMTVNPGKDWQELSAEFDTGEFTQIQFKTAFFGKFDTASPNTILWDVWTLKKTGISSAPEIAMNGLIPNGGFLAWIPGKPAPEKFCAPDAKLNHSAVYPMQRTDGDGDGASLEQLWNAEDGKDAPKTWFGVEIEVKPKTKYTFSCKGQDRSFPFVIAVYGENDKGDLESIQDPLVAFEGKNTWQQPETQFDSGQYSKIKIVTHTGAKAEKFPFYVIFDNWKVLEK